MNNTLGYVLAFSAGAAVGSVVAWKLLKTKYEQFAQAEIDSVKEVFSRRYKVEEKPEEVTISEEIKVEDKMDYRYIKKVNDYESNSELVEDTPEYTEHTKPVVIPPEEYGMLDYETESLVYYADGILVDENDDIIEDVDAVVGRDSLDCFGEYEDDSVFVRNDARMTDYEILRDIRTYAAASNFNARLTEDV